MPDGLAKPDIEYLLARSVLITLHDEILLSDDQLRDALVLAAEHHNSSLGKLEMTSIAGKKDYPR